MEIIKTHTGKIYVDRERKLEFLTVGDYGKENNIKADFLGYTKEINGVANTKVDLSEKWVATISTQHGCPMSCTFCDVPKFGFHGNVSVNNLAYQVRTILMNEDVKRTERFNLHFARMGEPTLNPSVLFFAEQMLQDLVEYEIEVGEVHPVISTMMPLAPLDNLINFLQQWCRIKNEAYEGNAGLQFSINSTDDAQRNAQFNGKSLNLQKIAAIASDLPMPIGRKYTLNFAVTKDTILDADVLTSLFDPKKFIVKLTPIHETSNAMQNGYDVGESYNSYSVYESFEKPLLEKGWDVIVFVPSKEEDADRITCGNALISAKNK